MFDFVNIMDKKKIKRICIYLTYDKENIVDEYIGYMLQELKLCSAYLVVVCNELEIVRGKEILEKYADAIFYRENIGLDAGGFKDALCHLLGWDIIAQYEELVLVNDSFFGPFKPMKDIFEEMEKKDIDFWGLTKHAEFMLHGFDYFPEHIQSFFIVIRNKMLHSISFKKYWEDMPYYTSYNQVVREHEMRFTVYFSQLGYKYDILADMECNNSSNPQNNYCQYKAIPYELIKKRNFPFLKKQQIASDKLEKQTQENLRQAMDYIDQSTSYDLELIWKNLIRTLNMSDLHKNLHLQYIICSDKKYETFYTDAIVIVFVKYKNSSSYIKEYLSELQIPVKIILKNQELIKEYKDFVPKYEVLIWEQQRYILDEICRYEFVCIIHDTDLTSEYRQNHVGKSYFFSVWNNLLKDKAHVQGILELFQKEKRLGLLMPPQPDFENYFSHFGRGWNGKFEEIEKVIKEKKLHCQISKRKAPFQISENIWIRGSILKKIEYWDWDSIAYLPYLWIYIAQDVGYYSGIIETTEYAAIQEINLQGYLEEIAEQVRTQYGDFKNFIEFKERILRAALVDFCQRYSHIYVYGIGFMARKYREWIPRPEAYVVSDGQIKLDELDGIPVKYLSEVTSTDDNGIVLCLNKENQLQVVEQLEAKGIKQYFCV